MAEDQNDAALRIVGSVLASNTISAAVFTTMYGMYLVVTFISWMLLWSKRENRQFFQMRLLMFSICIFVLTTILLASQTHARVEQIQATLMGDPSISFSDRVAAAYAIRGLTIASFWIASINSLYADAILIWRCWIISPNLRKWTFLPIFLWCVYCVAALVANITVSITSSIPRYFRYASTTGFVASFLVNVTATGTIAATVFRYRRLLKRSETEWRTPALRAALLFVESGLLFCFVQFTILILHLLVGYSPAKGNFSLVTAAAASYQCLAYLAALYPTVIVIIVHINRSFLDTTMSSDEKDGRSGSQSAPNPRSIVFATQRTTHSDAGPVSLDPLNSIKTDEISSQGKGSQYKYSVHEYPP